MQIITLNILNKLSSHPGQILITSVQKLRSLDRQFELLEVEAIRWRQVFFARGGDLKVQTHVVLALVVGGLEGHLLLQRRLTVGVQMAFLGVRGVGSGGGGGGGGGRAGLFLAATQGLTVAAGQRHRGRVGAARVAPVSSHLPFEAGKHLSKVLLIYSLVNSHFQSAGLFLGPGHFNALFVLKKGNYKKLIDRSYVTSFFLLFPITQTKYNKTMYAITTENTIDSNKRTRLFNYYCIE